MSGIVVALSVSKGKGVKKDNVEKVTIRKEWGIEGDAHAGQGIRQVSLLSVESIDKMRSSGLDLSPGDFAENITVKGIDLLSLQVGSTVRLGESVLLKVTQIGKECHDRCAIYYSAGDCVMPREGLFARVLRGGVVKPGDRVEIE